MAGTKVEEAYPEGGFGNLGIGNWFAISGDTQSHLSDNTLCIDTLPAAAGVNTEGKRQEAGGDLRCFALSIGNISSSKWSSYLGLRPRPRARRRNQNEKHRQVRRRAWNNLNAASCLLPLSLLFDAAGR